MAGRSRPFDSPSGADSAVLQPRRGRNPAGLGSSSFARHYLRNHNCFLFLRLLRWFSSAGWPSGEPESKGLSHSETHGSALWCSSPWLFAALRVLLRRSIPRHPPCALLTFFHIHFFLPDYNKAQLDYWPNRCMQHCAELPSDV